MSGLRQIATEPANLDLRAGEKMDRSPHMRHHAKSQGGVSDSELSTETNSLSAESNNDNGRSPVKSIPSGGTEVQATKSKQRRKGAEWEVIDSFKTLKIFDQPPPQLEGFMLKKRKWPLKGWHKRFFILEKGSLMYAKRPMDLARGKPHGSVDLGLSVISAKRRRCRIDIDAEVFIFHIKVKSREGFGHWLEALKEHRQYRQQQLHSREVAAKIDKFVSSPVMSPSSGGGSSGRDDAATTSPTSGIVMSASFSNADGMPMSREGSLLRNMKPSRAAALISESSVALDGLTNEMTLAQEKLIRLVKCADSMPSSDSHSTAGNVSPLPKKDRRKFVLRRKKNKSSSSNCDPSLSESETAPGSFNLKEKHSPLSCSIPSLSPSANGCSSTMSELLPPVTTTFAASTDLSCLMTSTDYVQEFLHGAQDLIECLTSALRSLNHERERLKLVTETASETTSISSRNGAPPASSMVASLRCALQVALQQNAELRSRLQKIRNDAELAISTDGPNLTMALELDLNPSQRLGGQPSLSYSSSCVSQSEFFDAKEYLTDVAVSDSSSDASETEMEGENEAEEEGSVSEASEMGNEPPHLPESPEPALGKCTTGRRSRLPTPKPSTEDLSLWNLMKRNIGKDLSKVSMPVVLNEPIGMLQRLSEELEYSELLDKASETEDAYERMVLIAAFAVSAYGSSHVRAGHKPFNPLLGETYECVREDRNFKYISEQVSHHPPISACHASSPNFEFWQDIRIKTKFWGKSMEFQPLGTVNVRLARCKDHYSWNKVTTCVHNLFGSQRWVDQYGELVIVNHTRGINCKLTFAKASYWSSNRYEVVGHVTDPNGKIVHNLFGKWSEGLYCGVAPSARCVWRPGALPEDQELYYGFSRFAIELNDLEPSLIPLLPPTDSRFRPDQRLLEEGNVAGAEASKLQLEQAQRERRLAKEQRGIQHQPKWFRKTNDGEKWEFTGTYWAVRSQSKFNEMDIECLW